MNNLVSSDIEKEIIDFLIKNQEARLKEFFLADLSWIEVDEDTKETMILNGYPKDKTGVIVNFFTIGLGKRMFDFLPKNIKDFIISNSNE